MELTQETIVELSPSHKYGIRITNIDGEGNRSEMYYTPETLLDHALDLLEVCKVAEKLSTALEVTQVARENPTEEEITHMEATYNGQV